MINPNFIPSSHLRPFDVHFLYDGIPTYMLVLARSSRHAINVMLRFFELKSELLRVTYDRENSNCFVVQAPYFSDAIYKLIKSISHGND